MNDWGKFSGTRVQWTVHDCEHIFIEPAWQSQCSQTDITLFNQKIEKLQASLHLLEDDNVCPVNQHVVFVDSEKEGMKYIQAIHVRGSRDSPVVRAVVVSMWREHLFPTTVVQVQCRTWDHMWLEFVVDSPPCSKGFSPGPPVSLPQSNLTWNSGQEEPPSGMFTAESLLLLLLILLLYTCILWTFVQNGNFMT